MYHELNKIKDDEVRNIVSEEVQKALILVALDADPLLVEASFIDAVSSKLKKTKEWTMGKIKSFLKSEIMQKIVQAIKAAAEKIKTTFDPLIVVVTEMAKDFEKGFKKLIAFLAQKSDTLGLNDVFIPVGAGVKKESFEPQPRGDIFKFCDELGISPSLYFDTLGEIRAAKHYRQNYQINEVFALAAFASHAVASFSNIIVKIAHETGNPKVANFIEGMAKKINPETLSHKAIEVISKNGVEYVNQTLQEQKIAKQVNQQKAEMLATIIKTTIVATFTVITILGVFHGGVLGAAEAVVLVLSSPQSMKELGEGMKQIPILKPIGHALELAGEKLVGWLKSDTMGTIHNAEEGQQPAAQPVTA